MVLHAPAATEHESKRRDYIDHEETKLVGVMGTLREQTLAKNREFKRQTDALESRRVKCEDRLVAETEARAESFARLKESVQQALVAFESEFETRSERTFVSLQTDGLDPIGRHVTATSRAMDHFFERTVPDAIEEQSGPVVRQMLKSRESFDIENTKLRAREAAIIAKFKNYCATTARRFEDEASDRIRIFTALAEALDATFMNANRDEERVNTETVHAVSALKHLVEKESAHREAEDIRILASLQDSIQKLQQQILDNFGASG